MKKLLKKLTGKIDFVNRFGTWETIVGLAIVISIVMLFPAPLVKACFIFTLLAYGCHKIFISR